MERNKLSAAATYRGARMSGNDLVATTLAQKRYVLGDDTITAEPIANMIRLPAEHEELVVDYHAVARDSRGRIYVLYNSKPRLPSTRAIARFEYVYDPKSGIGRCVFDRFLGTRDWAEGTVHSLNISREMLPDGTPGSENMVIVNTEGTIVFADLDGRVHWKRALAVERPSNPTCAVAATNAATIGVVDGYGSHCNFLYSKATGEILRITGATGSGDGQSNTNHGVDLDPAGNFVVSDRGNTRLTWWYADSFEPILIDGRQKALDMPELMACNVSFLGDYAVVPCLNSKLAFIGPDESTVSGFRVISVIQLPEVLVAAGIDGIHDAEFTHDGRYVIIGVWERNRNDRQIPTLTAFKLNWSGCLTEANGARRCGSKSP